MVIIWRRRYDKKRSIIGNNITGNGNISISFSNEDISKIIEQHKELTERLKTSQEQITTLLEILKKQTI